jgi:hypothetical protein
MDRKTELIKEFFKILDTVEESDSGTEFHPVFISSCRILFTKRIEEILKELKELVNIDESLCNSCLRADRDCPIYPQETKECVEYIKKVTIQN